MPYVCYRAHSFNPELEGIIAKADEILKEYHAKGYVLTLRQLYYQFVARDLLENTPNSYNRLGEIINAARLAGYIDWAMMEDRTRNLVKPSTWERPSDILYSCHHNFQCDLWVGQTYRPEVWIEKEALAGLIEGVCAEMRVPYFSCKGYTSQSEMWAHGRRFREMVRADLTPVIIHLGDHDPSGIDMTRDISERIGLFCMGREFAFPIKRIALNMDQIEEYNPPPNPAKITDSRAKKYMDEYGDDSWELDALTPEVIIDLIREEVKEYISKGKWDERVAYEDECKAKLKQIHDKQLWIEGHEDANPT